MFRVNYEIPAFTGCIANLFEYIALFEGSDRNTKAKFQKMFRKVTCV